MSNQNQKTWITSDLHFHHSNIIKYSPESRGHFTSVEEMNEAIVENINSKVREDDILIIAGDVCFAKPEVGVEFLKRINGFKKIVWGNHDKKLRDSSVFQQSRGMMGVVWEGDYLEFKHNFEGKHYPVVVSHFPFLTWDRAGHGSCHFFGHCHTPKSKNLPRGRSQDIGMDSNDMMPYDLDDLVQKMSKIDPLGFREGRGDRDRE